MKLSAYLILYFFTITNINSSNAQRDSLNSAQVLELMTETLIVHDPCHYRAQMRFKGFGEDTFEIRNFSINLKSNTAKPLFGYDWEISEEVDSGYTLTLMAVQNSFYTIYEGNKMISQTDLPQAIDLLSSTEYIRWFLVTREVLSHFVNIPVSDIILKASGNNYLLTREMNDATFLHLVVNKETFLPVQYTERILDNTLNFIQTTEINFFYDQQIKRLPDEAFSIEFYLSRGYTLKYYTK